jgi:hypothetical protein
MWSRPVDAASDNTHYIRGLAFHSCGGAEILDLQNGYAKVMWRLQNGFTAASSSNFARELQ